MNVPIPPLFLYEWDLGRYEVMDGQQRLNAVVDFYENGYALKGLEKWEELNGRRYKELPDTLQRGLDRRRLSATVLLVESTLREQPQRSDIRKLVFERLNTGGQELNAQELRNCLYAGPFNELLIRAARGRLFAEIWEIPAYEDNVDREGKVSEQLANHRLYRRMLDCEIVLRYFAFGTRAKVRGSVRSILDKCMEENLGLLEADTLALQTRFEERLALAHAIFGPHTFRYRGEKGTWRLSQPLYDAVMVAFDRLWAEREKLNARRTSVAREVSKLLQDEDTFAIIVGRPNTATAILRRIDLIADAMGSAAGV